MSLAIRLWVWALPLAALPAQGVSADPGGVLSHLTVARFEGSGAQSIKAMASDAAGNVYVAGTTTSPDLLVKNAAQTAIGEALLMRSMDRGATWQKIPNTPAVLLAFAAHPSDPKTMFAGSLTGVHKTVDGGQTWRRVHAWDRPMVSTYDASRMAIAIDPAHPARVYVHVAFGFVQFLASDDGGETWRLRDVPSAVRWNSDSLWLDAGGSGNVGLGLWRSPDQGVSWLRMARLDTGYLSFVKPDPFHAGWVYAGTAAGSSGRLHLSKDWGASWSELPSPRRPDSEVPLPLQNILFDPELPSVLFGPDTFGSLSVSYDSGASWQTPGGIVTLARGTIVQSRRCDGGGLLSLSLGSVVSSLDFGVTWQAVQLGWVDAIYSGPGCAIYAARKPVTSDAFVAKLAPGGGEVLWSTFLGGSEADAPVALALDAHGSVYVTGNTTSADFPTTAPRYGAQGKRDVFAVKFDGDGSLVYSVVYGGGWSGATAIAVNSAGEAHVVGSTDSTSFPVTAGAFQTELVSGGTGFAVKLDRDGGRVYGTYLPTVAGDSRTMPGLWATSSVRVAVVTEASGTVLIGGYGGLLFRLSADGSSLTAWPRQAGHIYSMETDGDGSIYVAGQVTQLSVLGSRSCFQDWRLGELGPGDIFVTKLHAESLQEVFSARLVGSCRSWPGTIKIGTSGDLTIGLWTWGDFPLRNPVLPVSTCGRSAVISRLSADGSSLLFSSRLDSCNEAAPAIALAPDGSIYAGVMRNSNAGVLSVPVAPEDGMSVGKAVNAFSGEPVGGSAGMLLTITGENLTSDVIDMGLNNPNPLPTQLGGVEVLFDGVPAEMFQVAPDHVICVVPAGAEGRNVVSVQVVSGALRSTPFVLRVSSFASGILTRVFPNLPGRGPVDANVRNADGTLNDAEHPAAPGSTVTIFATGGTSSGDSGLIWNGPPVSRNEIIQRLPATNQPLPCCIHAIHAIQFRIPDAPGPGVYLVPVPGKLTRAVIGRVDSGLGVYVK